MPGKRGSAPGFLADPQRRRPGIGVPRDGPPNDDVVRPPPRRFPGGGDPPLIMRIRRPPRPDPPGRAARNRHRKRLEAPRLQRRSRPRPPTRRSARAARGSGPGPEWTPPGITSGGALQGRGGSGPVTPSRTGGAGADEAARAAASSIGRPPEAWTSRTLAPQGRRGPHRASHRGRNVVELQVQENASHRGKLGNGARPRPP